MMQKLTELKEEIDSSMISVGDCNTPLTIIDRTTDRGHKEVKESTQ